jgi:hypothetical protein
MKHQKGPFFGRGLSALNADQLDDPRYRRGVLEVGRAAGREAARGRHHRQCACGRVFGSTPRPSLGQGTRAAGWRLNAREQRVCPRRSPHCAGLPVLWTHDMPNGSSLQVGDTRGTGLRACFEWILAVLLRCSRGAVGLSSGLAPVELLLLGALRATVRSNRSLFRHHQDDRA